MFLFITLFRNFTLFRNIWENLSEVCTNVKSSNKKWKWEILSIMPFFSLARAFLFVKLIHIFLGGKLFWYTVWMSKFQMLLDVWLLAFTKSNAFFITQRSLGCSWQADVKFLLDTRVIYFYFHMLVHFGSSFLGFLVYRIGIASLHW